MIPPYMDKETMQHGNARVIGNKEENESIHWDISIDWRGCVMIASNFIIVPLRFSDKLVKSETKKLTSDPRK